MISQPSDRRASLPRALRIRGLRSFQLAYREGARAKGSLLVVVARANDLPHSRLGLSVGKQIWKRAVRRNRLRRILREAFRLSQHALPPGFDFVLIPAAARLEPTLAAACAELIELARLATQRYAARRRNSAHKSAPERPDA